MAADRAAGPLPPGFAEALARLLAPGEAEAAAAVIETAAALDDRALARFLGRFAARVRASGAPITAAELRALLPPPG